MRRTFGPGISPSLPVQRCSLQAYPIARKFARIQGQVSQYSLPIFAHYVMRWSLEIGWDVDQRPWVASRQHQDGNRVAVCLGDPAEGVLRAWTELHRKTPMRSPEVT